MSPKIEVRRLPETADNIFWPAEMSASASGRPFLVISPVVPAPVLRILSCRWPEERFRFAVVGVACSARSSVRTGSDTKPDIQEGRRSREGTLAAAGV